MPVVPQLETGAGHSPHQKQISPHRLFAASSRFEDDDFDGLQAAFGSVDVARPASGRRQDFRSTQRMLSGPRRAGAADGGSRRRRRRRRRRPVVRRQRISQFEEIAGCG